LPFSTLLTQSSTDPSYFTLLPPGDLKKVIEKAVGGPEALQAILEGKKNVITSCGSGMSAAILSLALHELGAVDNVSLYDESWMGYAGRAQSAIVKGDA
jgi:thiosulfate/3-mercaptopyruvate sulfurtransferase